MTKAKTHWAKVNGKKIGLVMDGKVARLPKHPVIGKISDAGLYSVRIEPLTEEERRQLPLKNRLIWDLVKAAEKGERLSPNDIAVRFRSMEMYTLAEVREVYLQIGYSLGGFAELSYFGKDKIEACCWNGTCKKKKAKAHIKEA